MVFYNNVVLLMLKYTSILNAKFQSGMRGATGAPLYRKRE